MIRSKKITNSARGEACTLQIVGICNGNPETVVACHLPDESHGMGLKADDTCIVYGCHACHAVIDGQRYWQEYDDNRDFYLLRAYKRTIRRIFEKGVLKVA